MNYNNKRKRMIMIGGWTAIYKIAKDLGFSITLVHEKEKVKPEDLTLVEQLITSSMEDTGLVDIFKLLHEREPYDCVVSFQELGVLTAAQIKEHLNIFGNPLEPVHLTRDKGLMRNYMKEHRFPSIPYTIVQSQDDVVTFIEQVGLPIILKPIRGAGSIQIHKITEIHQVAPALELIRSAYNQFEVLVEKFVTGREVSVEGFAWEGKHTVIAITDKMITGAPYFVETGHNIPASLPEQTVHQLKQMTNDLIQLVGHQYGPTHTEVMIGEESLYVIETHTRTGGDYIYEMIDHVYGVNFFAKTLQGFAGMDPDVSEDIEAEGAISIRYLQLNEGKVKRMEGIEEARVIPGVIRCEIDLELGQVIQDFKNSTERYGFIMTRGTTVEESNRCVEQAIQTLTIEVE